MSTKQDHIKYRKMPFDCDIMRPILSDEDYKILNEYGTWMNALHKKKIDPINEKQKEFCKAINSEEPPEEQYANIFWRYLKRKEIAKSTKLNNEPVEPQDDREDWKKIRRMRF